MGDRILAIDRQLFTPNLSHEDAISILWRASGIITLVVARLDLSSGSSTTAAKPALKDAATLSAELSVPSKAAVAGVEGSNSSSTSVFNVKRSPSEVSDSSKDSYDMVLNTEWTQLECVELEGDGAGPGFGIVGGRSSGVIVKSLVPGGPASRVSANTPSRLMNY